MFKLKLLLYHSNCKFEYDKYHILSLVMPLYLVFKLLGMQNSLVNKYNIAGPRYTSYPTVPYWNQETFSLKGWKSSLIKSFKESNSKEGISIYIHDNFGTNPDGTLSVLLSREDFANIVGTAIESAIRVISQFKKEGLISTTGKYIKI